MKELLKLAGISGGNLLSYVAKLKKQNIDETILGSLTLQQLNNIGVTVLGDRLKIHKFFANDGNDCTSSSCKNNGICQDGFRCFSCRCDHNSGYYGPSCGLKCPCRNGGHCKTTRTGFKCECTPGYSGDLCETKYLNEDRFLNLEKKVKQLAAKLVQTENELNKQRKVIENLPSHQRKWKLHRANEVLNQLEKLQIHQSTPTYNQKLPVILPKGTQAILISIYCNFWNVKGHAYLNYEAYQKGNDKPEGKVYGYNTHFNVYANTLMYEQMDPMEQQSSQWDDFQGDIILFIRWWQKLVSSSTVGLCHDKLRRTLNNDLETLVTFCHSYFATVVVHGTVHEFSAFIRSFWRTYLFQKWSI